MNTEKQMYITLMGAVARGEYTLNRNISIRKNFDAYFDSSPQIEEMAEKARNGRKPKSGPQSRVLGDRVSGFIRATLGKRYEIHDVDTFALTKIETDSGFIRHTTVPAAPNFEDLKQGDVVIIECDYRQATNRIKILDIKSVTRY